MIKIDDDYLEAVGLAGLPGNEKNLFLRHVYNTLEERVGMRLADRMTNEQLDEFETYFDAKDDAGAFRWLEANFPDYQELVNTEFVKLKAEVEGLAPSILALSKSDPILNLNHPRRRRKVAPQRVVVEQPGSSSPTKASVADARRQRAQRVGSVTTGRDSNDAADSDRSGRTTPPSVDG